MVLATTTLRVFIYGLVVLLQPGADGEQSVPTLDVVLLKSSQWGGGNNCETHIPFLHARQVESCSGNACDPGDPWVCNGKSYPANNRKPILLCLDGSSDLLVPGTCESVEIVRNPQIGSKLDTREEVESFDRVLDVSSILGATDNSDVRFSSNAAIFRRFTLKGGRLAVEGLAAVPDSVTNVPFAPNIFVKDGMPNKRPDEPLADALVWVVDLPGSAVTIQDGSRELVLVGKPCGSGHGQRCIDLFIGNTPPYPPAQCGTDFLKADHIAHHFSSFEVKNSTGGWDPASAWKAEGDANNGLRYSSALWGSVEFRFGKNKLPNPSWLFGGPSGGYGKPICPVTVN